MDALLANDYSTLLQLTVWPRHLINIIYLKNLSLFLVFRISLVYYLLLNLLDQEAFISISPIHENICLPFITICLLDAYAHGNQEG